MLVLPLRGFVGMLALVAGPIGFFVWLAWTHMDAFVAFWKILYGLSFAFAQSGVLIGTGLVLGAPWGLANVVTNYAEQALVQRVDPTLAVILGVVSWAFVYSLSMSTAAQAAPQRRLKGPRCAFVIAVAAGQCPTCTQRGYGS